MSTSSDNTDRQQNDEKPVRRRRFGFRFLIFAIVAVALTAAGWWWVNEKARGALQEQFAAAGYSDVTIGSVQVGLKGVTATGIELPAKNGLPNLTLGSIRVVQPLSKLASGDTPFEKIELVDGTVRFDFESAKLDSSFSLDDLDLATLKLPAKQISVKNFSVSLTDADSDLKLQQIELTLEDLDSKVSISGNVGNVIEGDVEISGVIDRVENDLSITFNGSSLHLVDQDWQKWPGIPPAVLRHLGAEAVFELRDGVVKLSPETGVHYAATVTTKDASLFIPKFQLPIAVRDAVVLIEDGLVTYESVDAELGDNDKIHGSGTTTIAGFPCQTKFEGVFEGLDIVDLRKLVKAIPSQVVGTADGTITGSVDVNSDLETTLRISATGSGQQARYGQIAAAEALIGVEIQPLVLAVEGETVDLQGDVTVKAKAVKQDVDRVLATFDLDSLDQQFEFDVLGDGDVDLRIPLASAADLATWDLAIDATAAKGSISELQVEDLKTKVFLRDGSLVFDPAVATPAGGQGSVRVTVDWPLQSDANTSSSPQGKVTVAGRKFPPQSALKFLNRQLKNAGVEHRFESGLASIARSNLSGGLNFESLITLPAGADRPIESWFAAANVSDSRIELEGVTFAQLKTAVRVENGILSFKELSSILADAGSVDANVSMNLDTRELERLDVDAIRIPASWFAKKVARFTTENIEKYADQIEGLFSCKLNLRPQRQLREDTIDFQLTSEKLALWDTVLRSATVQGDFGTAFSITGAESQIGERGRLKLVGKLQPLAPRSQFQVAWSDIAAADLIRSLNSWLPSSPSFPATFDTGGSLDCVIEAGRPRVDGLISVQSLGVSNVELRDFEFLVRSGADRVTFETDASDRQGLPLKLHGFVATAAPFRFEIKAAGKRVGLDRIFRDSIGGILSTDLQVAGQLSPLQVGSEGALALRSLRFEGSELSPIQSKWKFSSQSSLQNRLAVAAFGGKLELKPESLSQADLVFAVSEFEMSQLAAFRKLPVALEGRLSGTAKIVAWRKAADRKMVVELEGDSLIVGSERLSRIKATGSLQSNSKNEKRIEYSVQSQWLDGKLELGGKAEIDADQPLSTASYPVKVRLSNARLRTFAVSRLASQWIRQVDGLLSISMDWNVSPGALPQGSGTVGVDDLKWRNKLVSRKMSSDVFLNESGVVRFSKIKADLRQGEIRGTATVPLTGSASGDYELDIRNFSLSRMLDVLVTDPIRSDGLIDARISGRTGSTITGSGIVGLSRAGLMGARDQSMRLPVNFRFQPARQTGRIEFTRSRFKLFNGNVNGEAVLDIGSSVRLKSKLDLSNIDSESMIRSLSGMTQTGQGKLSGRMILESSSLRSVDDLVGSFEGKLDQSDALALPVLSQISTFFGSTAALRGDRFESEKIRLRLSKGRLNVEQFSLQNQLAQIVISGNAWVDGRLDLEVAARIERLNQPTLLDQIAGSPLARLTGSPGAFFAQAAEFLSERIVFLDVGGTAKRPIVTVNTGKQAKEELIRYFLRGSQILPNEIRPNN